MPTLLLRLVGPMQSWGTTSRFDERDTGKEPSKSGVIGLVAAAMGIDRENWKDLEPLTRLTLSVRHDRPGLVKRDYQTAGCGVAGGIIKADGTHASDGVVSRRLYLADAAFLVGLEGDRWPLLERAYEALRNPCWPLSLGRKSYVPAESVWVENGLVQDPIRHVLTRWPWIVRRRQRETIPEKLLCSFESDDETGALRMDQPMSSFADRRFGARFVRSEWMVFPGEADHVPH